MELREGYKLTEIGVIPEDWEVKQLSEIGKFTKGQGISRSEASSGDIPCIRYGELYTKHSSYIKKCHSFISREVASTSKRLRKGDILFAGSGETKEEIGKCAAFIYDYEAYAGGDIVILSPKHNDSLFLGFLLNSPYVSNQKSSRGQGDAVVHISATQLKDIKIALPKLKEQKAIADALNDADALISSLEKLIAKKRNIKQGAMQRLLHPKDGYQVKKLGEVLKVKHGKSQKEIEVVGGTFPILGTGGRLGSTNHFLYNKPSVLIGRKGTIDKPQFISTPFWTVDTLFYTEINNGYDEKYIYYLFTTIDWYSYNEASGVPSLNAKTIESIEFLIPPSLDEQKAIAKTLTELELEISKLEKKLEKYKKIKKGMMQNLLTGKIRLIKKEEPHAVPA